MVIGKEGTGKTTFIKTFMKKLNSSLNLENETINSYLLNRNLNHTTTFTKRSIQYGTFKNSEKIFQLVLIDSPGYSKSNKKEDKEWLLEIKKYINNKVSLYNVDNLSS